MNQQDYTTMPLEQLVRLIASLYDNGDNYKAPYAELVSRVGIDEAERMVDAA